MNETSKWRDALLYTKDEKTLRRVTANAITILGAHEAWKGVLAFDAFRQTVVKASAPPWDALDRPAAAFIAGEPWTEEDTTRACAWLSRHVSLDVHPQAVNSAVSVVAERNEVHPVRDWLRSLEWDGVSRIDDLFSRYFGAENTWYARQVGAKFLIGAVARVFAPGCKVDCTPILEGAQGIGKSTAIRALASDAFFFDTPIDMGQKDSYQALHGKWIAELSELDSLNRTEVNRAKAFLTTTCDRYRLPYGRHVRDFPRQCVFVGTTNSEAYLKDETGSRRFWPIKCDAIDLEGIRRDRDQLWAEARARYERGESWYVDSEELRAACAAEQEQRYQADPWEEIVIPWLDIPSRRTDGVTTTDVLRSALSIEPANFGRAEENRVAKILARAGWRRGPQQRISGRRVRLYRPAHSPPVESSVVTLRACGGAGAPSTPSPPSLPPTTSRAEAETTIIESESNTHAGDTGDAVTLPASAPFADWLASEGITAG